MNITKDLFYIGVDDHEIDLFEGMYRVRDRGREHLDALRDECRRLIGRHLPSPPADLSPAWRGTGADGAFRTYLPLWTVFAAAGCLLIAVYSYHRARLTFAVAPAKSAKMLQYMQFPSGLRCSPSCRSESALSTTCACAHCEQAGRRSFSLLSDCLTGALPLRSANHG